MVNHKVNSVVLMIAAISFGLFIFHGSYSNTVDIVFAQPSASQSTSPSSSSIQITKDLTNSYTISSGSSSIGTFDATYTVLGNIDSINKEQNLVISIITDDFNNSPIAGYVEVSADSTTELQQQQPTLPNPFADNATISQKIETEINNAISSAEKSNFAETSIQCNFGMNLQEWKCRSHGLVG